jgi:hemolysin III
LYYGERFNSITHLIGMLFSVSGVSVLMTLAVLTGDTYKIVSCGVFGGGMVFLYSFSTLYHSLQGKTKKFFQRLDYIAIYFMIAGTYTPFTLVTLRDKYGWWVFGFVWGLALFGILQEIFRVPSPKRKLSLFLYLAMGWMILSVAKNIYESISAAGITWLILGGLFYTVGVLFFVNDEKWKHAHGIWHLFVLAGSTCHFFCVLLYIV